jgi:hypothetical protein
MCIRLRAFHLHRPALWAATTAITAVVAGALCFIKSAPSSQHALHLNRAGGLGQRFPLAISPDPITFGVLNGRTSVRRVISARNMQNVPLRLARIETSCPCIRVVPLPVQVAPDETQNWTVTFDPSAEPDFKGSLAVEVTGYLPDGEIAFRTNANLEVRPVSDR